MGDSEGKPLIFVITALFFFFLLVGTFPAQISVSQNKNYDVQTPSIYRGLNIGDYAFTTNFTLEDSTFDVPQAGWRFYYFELGGSYWYIGYDTGRNKIVFGVRNYWGIFLVSLDACTFKTEGGENRGTTLEYTEMNKDYAGSEGWVKYRVYLSDNPAVACDVNLGFNTSLYSSPSEAFSSDGLKCLVGLGLEDTYSTMNAWQLIGAMLFFRAPNIHPVINAFIVVPLWAMFIYAAIRLLLRFIPMLG